MYLADFAVVAAFGGIGDGERVGIGRIKEDFIKSLAMIMSVFVFAFLGFEHSVANTVLFTIVDRNPRVAPLVRTVGPGPPPHRHPKEAMSQIAPFDELDIAGDNGPIPTTPQRVRELRLTMQRFLLQYEFGLREIETKLSILRDEFLELHDYNPIEHVSSRVKSPESLIEKIDRKALPRDLDTIRANITDIAGIRVTCSFVSDVYRLFDVLTRQDDVVVRTVKDYIAEPKPNGYQSLHAIVEIPVFLSSGTVTVPVEVQFRTIAMDFWASLEHKIYYKYDQAVPSNLVADLQEAAAAASALDSRMERLHRQTHGSPTVG